MSGSFVHLHNHTEYSMLDGAAKVKPMLAEAQRLEMPAIGMTDHGNMFGASEFYNAATDAGIKPIIGIEAYIAPASRFETKRVLWGDPSQKSDDVSGSGSYTHMTMVAENATGLRNLFKLSSLASFEGQLGKWARMDAEIIAEHAEGIIATTGCPSGEVQTRLRLGHDREALEAAARWREIFGPENFFLELMDHGLDIERRVREGLLDIGQKLGIPPLATNDCHYVTRDAAQNHEALLCIQTGKTLSDPNRFKFDGDGYFLKSAAEMRALWDGQVPGACDSTLLIAERVQSYADVWTPKDRMPIFPVPEGHDQGSWLTHEVMTGLQERRFHGAPVPQEYIDRAQYEIKVICDKGFPAYFLIVADLINYARSVGIRVGPGRGSAAGSLVAYAMGITNIDPIPHGLLFERFLNPERPSAPDIDIDFDDRRRGEMLRYAANKWGSDRVAQVITFGTIKTKAALKDSARVHYGQPGFAIADRITKALPPPIMAKDIPVSGITDPTHERYKEAAEVRALIDTDPDVRTIYETARGLEGLVRNAGVHACAVIMSSEPLIDAIPLWKRPQDGAVITGWDYPSCEAIGLLKMDFLGLRNLTIIGDCIENIKANRGIDVDLESLTLDDPKAYELLGRGDTLGVFQLDGGPMRDLLRRMQPTEFNDIVAVLALYRPGPMGMNAHNDYADRKNGRQAIKPIHPELEEPLKDILSETYGLIVYQEQIMFIAQKVASYSMGKADALRKAMGKKKLEVLEAEYQGFKEGMTANGFSEKAVKALWDTILPFAGYAFNKSHAAGYGLVSYWTAYLKANYPAEYMAGLLTSVGDDKDKAAVYLADCRRLGITVLPPDVNESVQNFASVGDDIRFGLGAVRNVGANVVSSLVATRKEKGKFADFSDYLNKIDIAACNKKVTESLVKAGAFDSLGHPRKGLFLVHTDAVDSVLGTKKAEAMGQFDLFGGADGSGADAGDSAFTIKVPDEEWEDKHKLALEREMLGLYVSGHPLNGVAHLLAAQVDTQIPAILDGDVANDTQVRVGGILASVNRRVNKNGLPWASAQIEDLTGGIEVLFFPQTYSMFGAEIADDVVVLVGAKVAIRDDRISLIANELVVPDFSSANVNRPVAVSLPTRQCTVDKVTALKQVLARHPGTAQVHLRLISGERITTLELDQSLRVTPSSALMGDLKELLGPGCLGG
ncbi:DNA polymerase III subunit alpha [Mycolicibacterium austroafricanum]|jgi:DNA polymerase-3 subunit alpha|uniref:DNA-directed DNA polymerase n=3 Tax=Mycolicibacterium TaxID=1866885 RepID=A0ABT8HLJ9_MYCAO|nr:MULTISPECIES: DNA polymerase III subunit alpha [Mycolicibacterium]MDN4521636.1 DNA polymerase III subunit alpha [Mycolicibacterium austroafricanum]MDW5610313.1 DNA polymerase III subunit alpha [Mycolicibacterium sp. D5.8-2]PQP39652.1 DNA polymerase III subunit alpha [Mycolicibacterium austroafricanum]QRZ09332.1 DNA polymerase III subunit alpha [Mycolicibacterium austroafricanum]QZT59499.1 DNA polymerase III subunit alpha [Mycolicibacterium austroafricanum]